MYAVMGLGASAVTCEGDIVSAEGNACCRPSEWDWGTYARMAGLESMLYYHERMVLGAIANLLRPYPGYTNPAFVDYAADQGVSVPSDLESRLRRAYDNFLAMFPEEVTVVGPTGTRTMPRWQSNVKTISSGDKAAVAVGVSCEWKFTTYREIPPGAVNFDIAHSAPAVGLGDDVYHSPDRPRALTDLGLDPSAIANTACTNAAAGYEPGFTAVSLAAYQSLLASLAGNQELKYCLERPHWACSADTPANAALVHWYKMAADVIGAVPNGTQGLMWSAPGGGLYIPTIEQLVSPVNGVLEPSQWLTALLDVFAPALRGTAVTLTSLPATTTSAVTGALSKYIAAQKKASLYQKGAAIPVSMPVETALPPMDMLRAPEEPEKSYTLYYVGGAVALAGVAAYLYLR